MDRTLIVAKVVPTAEQRVAQAFAESDRTDLPRLVGVRHRSLYRLDDLYVHLMESDRPAAEVLRVAPGHPEFARVSRRLRPYVSPYRPTWRSPDDALARCFYHWDAPAATTGAGS